MTEVFDPMFPLPHVDDVIPLWTRPKGQRGGLTTAQKQAKADNARDRAAYERVWAACKQFAMSVVHRDGLIRDKDETLAQLAREFNVYAENKRRLLDSCSLQVNELYARISDLVGRQWIEIEVGRQLDEMMPDDKPKRVDGEFPMPDNEGAGFQNRYGQFKLVYERLRRGGEELEVHPAGGRYNTFYVDVDRAGILPDSVVKMASLLGLADGPDLTERAREAFRAPSAESEPSDQSSSHSRLWVGPVEPIDDDPSHIEQPPAR